MMILKKITKHSLLLLILSFINFGLLAQAVKYKGVINTPDTSKYKSIALTPKIRAVANADFNDIRIFDEQEKQVPYFLLENFIKHNVDFIPLDYKIVDKKKLTSIIIYNPERKLYRQFNFKVSNANVRKTCKIEGSADLKKWFVVSEKLQLVLDNNYDKAYNYYNLDVPSIDYQFIKLTINDSISSPLNIKNVGVFKSTIIKNENPYIELDYTSEITQKSNKTLIHCIASNAFEINRIDFKISGNNFYDRTIRFYTEKGSTKKDYSKNVFRILKLNSKNTNSFYNLKIIEKDFWIEVDNKDNQPLHFDAIKLFQKQQFLVAPIKSNNAYHIIAGNKKLHKPSYDIEKFKNEIDRNFPIININNEEIYKAKIIEKQKIAFYEKPLFMWISIGFVTLIILFFTLSLLKKTKQFS